MWYSLCLGWKEEWAGPALLLYPNFFFFLCSSFFFFFIFAKKLVIVNLPHLVRMKHIWSSTGCIFALNRLPARRTQTSSGIASDIYRTDFLAPLRQMTKELFLVPLWRKRAGACYFSVILLFEEKSTNKATEYQTALNSPASAGLFFPLSTCPKVRHVQVNKTCRLSLPTQQRDQRCIAPFVTPQITYL